jgi:IS5 family transposase
VRRWAGNLPAHVTIREFRVIKRQYGFVKVLRYRGLKKNTLQFKTLCALPSLWVTRHKLMRAQA